MERIFAKKTGIVLTGFFFIMLISVSIPHEVMAADTIKIGQIDPFSGVMQAWGNAFYQSIKFVVDEQNSKGGLFGKKIEILKADSEFKPDVTVRRAREFIFNDKVDFLGLALGSHLAVALNRVADENKKIFINYGAISDPVMGKEFSRYAFRVYHNSYALSSSITEMLANKSHRRIYLIAQDVLFGHDTHKRLRELITSRIPNAEIVGEDLHPMGTKDFAPYITKMKAAKPDIILAGTIGADTTNLVLQIRSLGFKAPFPIVLVTTADPAVVNLLKDDAEGILFTCPYMIAVKTPDNEKFIAKWREFIKGTKDIYTMWPEGIIGEAVFAWKMVLAATEKAGSLDPEKIINAFEGFRYETPVGWWEMRKCDHQLLHPMFAAEIKTGRNPWYNGSINPEVNMPWVGPDIMTIPAGKVAIPATKDYNPRCP